jgi:hypothetical protein
MRETWYVLEDGNVADPADVAYDKNGVLRHRDGVAVAMRGQVPHSRSVDPAEERGKAKAKAAARSDGKGKTGNQEPEMQSQTTASNGPKDTQSDGKPTLLDMKPEEQGAGYKTRDTKAGR